MVRNYDESAVPSVYNLAEAPPVRDEPGFRQVVFRGIDQMIGFSVVGPDKPDAEPHSHPWEQMNYVAEGRVDFVVGDEVVTLERHDAITIPPGVEHTSRAVADEPAVLLAFWPLREDRLDATDYQDEFRI
ncbi:MAG: cupin domain-containing protein [Haloferacaceae archaeon]